MRRLPRRSFARSLSRADGRAAPPSLGATGQTWLDRSMRGLAGTVYVERRIGIGITALLTLVALQLISTSGLPDVNYLILLDKLYIVSYAFVVLTMAVIVRNSWVDATGDVAVAARADRRGLLALTVAYFAAGALLLIITLA